MNVSPDNDSRASGRSSPPPASTSRFLTLGQVSEELATSTAQTYALVRSGALRAIKIGGRGQWRVARQDLEDYVTQAYQDTAAFVRTHPLRAGTDDDGDAPPS